MKHPGGIDPQFGEQLELPREGRMRVGFTGTRDGMTEGQKATLYDMLDNDFDVPPPWTEFHHGDCVGADEQAHDIAVGSFGAGRIVIHPPSDSKLRAFCNGASEMRNAKPYLDRNRDIVDETDLLIATPREGSIAISKGGTFYTIRYALKRGKPIKVIWPDGNVEDPRPAWLASRERHVH